MRWMNFKTMIHNISEQSLLLSYDCCMFPYNIIENKKNTNEMWKWGAGALNKNRIIDNWITI